jgi:hypothetical protein
LSIVHPLYELATNAPGVTPLATSGPTGYTPAQVKAGYGINQIVFPGNIIGDGAGQTIAIVDAYDDPTIVSDLNAFSTTFGLPTTTSGQFTFTKVNEDGGTALPSGDTSWAVETSLDVEWAHAIAPRANIMLVEAFTAFDSDIYAAISYAASQRGVSVVSMSFGESEQAGETSLDSQIFTNPANNPGVAFVASAGDQGAPPEYPSASPDVLAIGGTPLSLNSSGAYLGETAWSGSGGGISAYESQPSYQQGIVTQSSTQRTTPDVAYDANPGTGFPVYDSYTYGTSTPWQQVGGTSCGAPQWSALVAIADEGRALAGEGALNGPTQLLPMIYGLPSTDFHDITSGRSDGNPSYSAGPGYDLVTGLGSPVANLVVAGLVGTPAVASTSTSVTSSANPSSYGQSVTFTATVTSPSGIPGGSVTFMSGTTSLGTETLSNGTATFSTSSLAPGNYSITADYSGATGFAASSSSSLTQVVNASPITIGLSSSLNPAALGQSVTFTAVITGPSGGATPTGSVTFFDGNTALASEPLSAGSTSLTTSALPLGSDSITAVYSGDGNYNSATSSPLVETVTKATASVLLNSSANPSLYEQPITFTATVSGSAGTPTGTVAFMNGSTTLATRTLSGGTVTFTDSAFQVGSYGITAVYSGDGSFNGGTSAVVQQTVNKASTTNQLTVSPSPASFGQTITLTSTVSVIAPAGGVPIGTVTFRDGSVTIGQVRLTNGVAVLQTSTLAAGTHNLTAIWFGDGNNIGSTSPVVAEVVSSAPKTPSATVVTASADPTVTGQSVTFTALVTGSGGTPTGSVTFLNGTSTLASVPLSNGSASYSTALAAAGSLSITAVYGGDGTYAASTSSPLTQTVNPASSSVALTSSTGNSTAGQSVTFTAVVTAVAPGAGTPTGSVTFFNGTTSLGSATLSGGTATFATAALPVGSDSVTAVYNGDGNYASATSQAVAETVNQPSVGSTATLLSTSLSPSIYSQAVTFTAQVTSSSGTPTGTVTFMNGTATLATKTLSGGIATFSTSTLPVGTLNITAVYSGSSTFTGSTSAAVTQTVKGATTTNQLVVSPTTTPTFGQTLTLTSTVSILAPASGIPNGTVTFRDGSVTIGQARLSGGVATLQISTLAVGTHNLIAIWYGDGNNIGSTSAAVQVVVSAASPSLVSTDGLSTAATFDVIRGEKSTSASVQVSTVSFSSFTPGAASPSAGWIHFVMASIGSDLEHHQASFRSFAAADVVFQMLSSLSGDDEVLEQAIGRLRE